MKVTIIKDDNIVIVNNRSCKLDLTGFPSNIHAIQFDNGSGHIEFNDGTSNKKITDLSEYQVYITRWQDAIALEDAPAPEPTPEELAKIAEKAALQSLRDSTKATSMYNNLKTADYQEINTYIEGLFPSMTQQQKDFIKLLTGSISLYLRER